MNANKKKLILSLTGIGAGLSIAAAIYFSIQKKNEKKSTNEESDFENKAKTNPEELTKPEKTELLKKIKIHHEGEYLTIQTIEDIAETILRFCVPDFIKLSRRIRKERREVTEDHAKRYVELQAQYEEELRNIIAMSKAEVLERLNLNAVTFDLTNPLNDDENIEKTFTLNAVLRKKLL